MIGQKYIYTTLIILCFSSQFSFSQTDKRVGICFNNLKNTGAKNQFASLSQLIPKALSINFETDTTYKVLDINSVNFKRLNSFESDSTQIFTLNSNDLYYIVDTTEETRKLLLQSNIRYFITGNFTSYQDKINISITPLIVGQKYFSRMNEISLGYNSTSQLYTVLNEFSQRLQGALSRDSVGKRKKVIDFWCPSSKDQQNKSVSNFLAEISSYFPQELGLSFSAYTFTPYEETKKFCGGSEDEILHQTKSDGIFRLNYENSGADSLVLTLNFLVRNFNNNNFIEIDKAKFSREALYHLMTRLYSSAGNFLQAAIKKDSTWDYSFLESLKENNKDRLTQIGKGYLRLSNWPAAAVCFSRVINIDSTNVDAINALAFADHKQYYFNNAQELYLQSLAIDSVNNLDAMAGLGDTYFQQGDFISAAYLFEKVRKKQSDYPNIDLLMGKAYLLQDSTNLAQTLLEIAVKKDSNCFDCYYLLGQTHESKLNYTEAIKYYRKAIAVAPEKTEAKNSLSNLLDYFGNLSYYNKEYKKALSYYYQSDSVTRTVYSLDKIRVTLDNIGEYSKADEIVNLLINAKYYTEDSIYYNQASTLSVITDSLGNPFAPAIRKSLEYLAKYDSLVKKVSRTVTLYGVNYFNLNDHINTLKYYRMATILDSNNIYSYLNLAEFLITTCDSNNVREALMNSEKALTKLNNTRFPGKQLNGEDKLVAYYLSAMALKILEPAKIKKRKFCEAQISELSKNVGMIKIWSFATFNTFAMENTCYRTDQKKYLCEQTKKMIELTQSYSSFNRP